MLHRTVVLLAILLVVYVLPSPARAEEEDGWEQFEAVPTWVTEPPVEEGKLCAVDVGLSNLLSLAYDPDLVPRDRLNLRWQIERRLRRLLGEGAQAPALAGARAATVVRKGYHLKRAKDTKVVGGQVYSAFVLWETPLSAVLEAIPEAQRDAAVVLLRARVPEPAWTEVEGEPDWVAAPTLQGDRFVAVATETSDRADVARAVSDLRSRGHVRHEVGGRLRFHLGNDLASVAASDAVSYGTVLQRAWQGSPARAWTLWAVPLERILANVPADAKEVVTTALSQPIPPRPWKWQAVDAKPAWVDRPPRWPDHMPYVQTVTSAQADVARKHSIRNAEREIGEDLERLLQPVVGSDAASAAARAGAKGRQQGAHAIRERDAGPVRAWTLWQIPIAKVLEALDPEHHEAARKALLP